VFAPEAAIRSFDNPPGHVVQFLLGHVLPSNVDANILLHARRHMLRAIQRLLDDIADQAVRVGIDVVVLRFE